MNLFKQFYFVSPLIMVSTIPALAGVTVNSPANSADVKSPFQLSATAATCSSQNVSAMGYSIDTSSDTTVADGSTIDASVAASTGNHTVHVKAWGDKGASCVTDVAVTVETSATSSNLVPPQAQSVSNIQALGGWRDAHDTGGQGSSSGSMSVVNSPARTGNARKFVTSYSGDGDERYSVTFGDDQSSTNFLWDGWVYFTSSLSKVGNLELDLNQVMPNGENAIFAMQCAGDSNTWDYTENAGTPQKSIVKWVHSKQACNPRTWSVNTWHHVQLSYSRTDSGEVTYKSVWLDDKEQAINATVKSAFALGWGPTLQTQFQVDGIDGSGTTTVYLDDLTVYRW
jgi:hypothetical protein